MATRLKDAWQHTIGAEDYEAHMASIGQAQANADLVAELFRRNPPTAQAPVLFAGAGPGQMFDYLPPALLSACQVTFTDINPQYLARLRARLDGMSAQCVLDDIEDTSLSPGYELAIVVLVLEHVEWKTAVATLCRLAQRIFIVIQENPPESPSAVTRPLKGSMTVFQEVHPRLISRGELEEAFAKHGFALCRTSVREVLDNKKMLGMEFEKH